MSFHRYLRTFLFVLVIASAGCTSRPASELRVDFEKYTLDNGLDVVFHLDRSDPIVAVAMTYHVGSSREVEGRTGFAHLFEHLLFLESENVGKGGLDILITKVGGSLNGSTSRDRTNYFQTVPRDALEKILWAEADKMGFFIHTVTESVVAKEKQVVKNEKRQGVDNRPYGHTSYVIDKNLYTDGQPYNWQVIGSLEDLDKAELQDVKDFYNRWYGPNNATLVIAGDFDPDQTREWVEHYFGEFESRGDVETVRIERAAVRETRLLFHEDNFARVPALTITWPAVEQYHPDAYALNVLARLLSSGKKAPFYQILVEERQVTSNVSMFNRTSELAGQFQLSVRAFPFTPLDTVTTAIDAAFARFESEGIQEADLERIKAGAETSFYNRLSSVLGKAFQLAQYNIFAGDPGFATRDIQNLLDVTIEDVERAYEKYIKDRPYVATSFVPLGQTDLVLSGSIRAEVVEEPIVQGAEEAFVVRSSDSYEKTPSLIDRTVEPPFGDPASVTVPDVWTATLENGMDVYGIENDETPLVQFNIRLKGGLLLDDPAKVGVANLLAQMMTAGTARKTPIELEEAIEQLGASISVSSGRETFAVRGNSLARHFEGVIELVEEILLEPRWDEKEFDLIKQRTLNQLRQQQANPTSIAGNVFNKLLYGEDHILSENASGTLASVERITIEDLRGYYEAFISPSVAAFHIAGAIGRSATTAALASLASRWEVVEIDFPVYTLPEPPQKSTVYFVDVPDAKQSVLRVGYLAMPETDPDYFPASVMNFKLGGGGFASELLQVLREQKGYTYGIGSGFSGSDTPGPFSVGSNVRTNITYEALDLVKDILQTYEDDFSEAYLGDTKSFMIRSNARRFETLGAKLGILQNISAYDWPHDYAERQQDIIRNLGVDDIKRLAREYVDTERMIWLVTGDAKTQMPRLGALGFGDPILIDQNARPVRE